MVQDGHTNPARLRIVWRPKIIGRRTLSLHWDGSACGLEAEKAGGHVYHHSMRTCPPARLPTRRAIKEEGRERQEMEEMGFELGQTYV